MVDGIGPSYNLPPSSPSTPSTNVPALAKDMQIQVEDLAAQLQQALDDPSVTIQSSFLQKITDVGSHLNQIAEQALKLR